MNKYYELKSKRQNEINKFPIGFAYSDKQFKESMEKLGLTENDTDKVTVIRFVGGFIRKTDTAEFKEMMERHENEKKAAMQDDQYLYDMFRYELSNHKYCVGEELEDTLDACGLTIEEVEASERLKNALIKARKDYMQNVRW